MPAPLHPQAAKFLADRAALGLPVAGEVPISTLRKNTHLFINDGGPSEIVADTQLKTIPTPTADISALVITPEGPGPFPVLLFFHGGGWVFNFIEMYQAPLSAIANRTKSVVIAVNYQKAPEHKFPIPFDDCWASVEWVIENAKTLNIDPKKIAVSGDSAGGNLASAVALKARDENIELAYQLLLYPCNQKDTDTESMNDYAEGYGLTRDRMVYLWDQYLNGNADDKNPYAVPQSAPTLKGLAPAIVILAQCDVLYSDGKKYAQRLSDEGVSVSLREYPGMVHGFFSHGAFVTDSLRLREEISAEINQILGS